MSAVSSRVVIGMPITRLNHAYAIPGAGLDPDSRAAYFRTYVPIATGPVPSAVVQAMFSMTVSSAANLQPVLQAVVAGQVAPADVVAAVNQQMSKG